ncbi:DGQHR domain-containing protein [Mesorhizobium sp. ISC15]|uniref:DGQHR domain-containing protein n=1 Tax=Mesorhizobium sp. ISC15 TaxID=3076429 RepID=UPI00301CDA65
MFRKNQGDVYHFLNVEIGCGACGDLHAGAEEEGSRYVISYTGILVEQRPGAQVKFLVFVADAKEVVGWAEADNIKLDRGNVQRELVESRWRQIRKFFNASPNNVIPTSVTIALDESIPQAESVEDLANAAGFVLEDTANGMTKITFDPERIRGAAFIIDGQHRLKGMSMLDYDVKVPICLFLSLPKVERAFQFVTINNKSHKVPTGNLKALLANFEDRSESAEPAHRHPLPLRIIRQQSTCSMKIRRAHSTSWSTG